MSYSLSHNFGYGNIVFTGVIAEIWKQHNKVQWGETHRQLGDQVVNRPTVYFQMITFYRLSTIKQNGATYCPAQVVSTLGHRWTVIDVESGQFEFFTPSDIFLVFSSDLIHFYASTLPIAITESSMFSGCPSVHLYISLLWTQYLKNSVRDFPQIWHKHFLGLIN